MGGLGNQMFQISKAIVEGLKNDLPVFFRTSAFIPMEGNQPTNYIENIFRNYFLFDIYDYGSPIELKFKAQAWVNF